MRCPRCLNTDPEYFYKGSKGWYCRRCISFGRAMIEEESAAIPVRPAASGSEEFMMRYPLTEAQKEISYRCSELIDHTDVLLYCVCGAGKTEKNPTFSCFYAEQKASIRNINLFWIMNKKSHAA